MPLGLLGQGMVDGPPVSSFLVRKPNETFDSVSISGNVDVDLDVID